jgi:prepilin-type N-terminal cleavage/methylation domain-containing protein
MNMKRPRQTSLSSQAGFSLLELIIATAILTIVMAAVFNGVNLVTQRSQAEQVKVDLTQEGREFIDEFERDLHQAGYPNCRMVATSGTLSNCDYTNTLVANNSKVAAGLVYVSSTLIIFEGDVDGDGAVDSVQYQLVDSANVAPTVGSTCPCTIRRSQVKKDVTNSTTPLAQTPSFSQELQNVVNSGQPTGTAQYGNGLTISGTTAWGATNTAYYAAISSFKDYPVFQAYDQLGNIIPLPLSIANPTDWAVLTCAPTSGGSCVKSIRLTINLLANGITGIDSKTNVRPVTTLVGDVRLVNN